MARTGYGRTSSLNRIAYRSTSSRTYRGVKTPRMVADMSSRMAKAQDQVQKDAFDNGQISLDQYTAYLGQRISQTSDPSYRETLTQSLHSLITTDNEKQMTQGYSDGTVTAGQLESYFKSKLNGLDPNSYAYQQTKNDIAKWGTKANSDAYKAQEAVLKEQYNGAADKLNSAQKLLDFYVQQTQALTPGTPEYNTAVTNIGTYQSEVRKISFEQQLLKAEDTISQTYAKDTPENWNAKSQMYGQLRDAAAAQGDITNFYKYDQLANTANDNIATSQAKVVSKQVTEAIHQTQADYLSGKIDAQTAQNQMMQISDAALQANDTNGVIIAHDYYNKIESDINHGVSYGGDNGFGKTKGGGGGEGVYDLSTGQVIGGGSAPSSRATARVTAAVSGSSNPSSYGGSSDVQQGSILDQAMKKAGVVNAPAAVQVELANAYANGANIQDMVNILRVKKIGTGDGWKALSDVQKSTSETLNAALHLGYDPLTGLAFTPDQFRQAMLDNNTSLAAQYGSWQSYIQANPNAKINIGGTNTKLATLADNVDKILNGTTKIDPATGMIVKDTPGLIDSLQTLSNPNSDFTVVEDPKNPGQFIPVSKAQFEQANGSLAGNYVQDENGVYHFINSPKPVPHYFQTQKEANQYAADNKIPLQSGVAGQQIADGRIVVYTPNSQPRSVTVQNGQGQSITYLVDGGGKVTDVKASPGALPNGYKPSQVMSFGGAQLSVPSNKLGITSGFNQQVNRATQETPANLSTRFGPRYADEGSLNVSKVPANTSTPNGSVYTPPPATQNFSPVQQPKQPSFSTAPQASIVPPVIQPIQRPVDNLVAKILPASSIPKNTPLNPSPSQQPAFKSITPPQPQQNPASSSAPLTIAGQQPTNNIQQSGIRVNIPPVQQSQASNPWSSIGNTFGNIAKGIGGFFGFH